MKKLLKKLMKKAKEMAKKAKGLVKAPQPNQYSKKRK